MYGHSQQGEGHDCAKRKTNPQCHNVTLCDSYSNEFSYIIIHFRSIRIYAQLSEECVLKDFPPAQTFTQRVCEVTKYVCVFSVELNERT